MTRVYNEHEKRLIAYALRSAKVVLWDGCGDQWGGPHWSICSALPKNDAGDLAREVVMTRLDGFFGVRRWLVHYGYLHHSELHSAHDKVQAYRHAWVDELIKEFSE